MTFNNTAWAIDGATTNSALARAALYISTGGDEGIAQRSDLKVRQLGVAGQGVLIDAGSALILNRYQGSNPDQSYTVTNPAQHTVLAAEMPAANPAAKSYILAIVVGDPEFSQVGHPWMTGTDPGEGNEADFLYVRPTLISVASGATDLGNIGYPAVPLARIDIPANTTTIVDSYIHDLRSLARPRSQLVQGFAQVSSGSKSITTSYQRFPDANAIVGVKIPSWASTAKIQGFVEGIKLQSAGGGQFRAFMTTGDGRATGEVTNVNEVAPGTVNQRRSYNVGGELDVSDISGQTHNFGVEAKCNTGDGGFLTTDASGSVFLSVYFEEKPV
jgi:hypothetical protein